MSIDSEWIALQNIMLQGLPERQRQITQAWSAWCCAPSTTTHQQLIYWIHQLVGAAGAYQLDALYRAAADVEQQLKKNTCVSVVEPAYQQLQQQISALILAP